MNNFSLRYLDKSNFEIHQTDNSPTASYINAEKKADWYVKTIQGISQNPDILVRLKADFEKLAKQQEERARKFDSVSMEDHAKVGLSGIFSKLKARKQLSNYLRQTIAYLFVRDLGMDLTQADTEKLINSTVDSLVKSVQNYRAEKVQDDWSDSLNQLLDKYEIRNTYQWLVIRLSSIQHLFIDQQSKSEGMRKLVKVIAGIMMHHLTHGNKCTRLKPEELSKTLMLGYAYGLTYPFVDDLLDSKGFLTESDKHKFNQLLRTTILTGRVQDFPDFESTDSRLEQIYTELKWAFEYIQKTLDDEQSKQFFEQSYIFFEAQAQDRLRRLSQGITLSTAELYRPVVLKAAGCRLISRDLVSCERDTKFDERMFCYGIYNQFNDDIKDIFEDIEEDNLTPYTHYLSQLKCSENMTNPYQFYWAVVYYLVYVLYDNHPETKQLILLRSLNAHKSVLLGLGEGKYQWLRKNMLFTSDSEFNDSLNRVVYKTELEPWFDKLISTEVSSYIKSQSDKKAVFKDSCETIIKEIESKLDIKPLKRVPNGQLSGIANYALNAGGKRIRSVIASYIGKQLYGFNPEQYTIVAKLLEYMHTASLVMDDLPSQDDADLRRGKPTVHSQYDSVAKAELSVVYLMMHAVEIQASFPGDNAQAVLDSLSYAAQTTKAICEGQLLDLDGSQRINTVEDIKQIIHLKTGLALEASLVIPAILANQNDIHIGQLKTLAKHMGMIFQLRDDLLDHSGHSQTMGKAAGTDHSNGRITLVTRYGEEETINLMFEHYYSAKRLIHNFPEVKDFFDELIDFMIFRVK